MKNIALILATLLFSTAAWTHNPENPTQDGNKVRFSVKQSVKLDNDRVAITFNSISEGETAAQSTEKVFESMKKAAEIYKDYPVKVKTTQFSTNPVYKDKKISHWRTVQAIEVKGEITPKTLSLMNTLDDYVNYQRIAFYISESKKTEAISNLTKQALISFKLKAKEIAHTLSHDNYRILETNIQTPIFAASHESSRIRAMSAKNIEGGESALSVSVSGLILLPNTTD